MDFQPRRYTLDSMTKCRVQLLCRNLPPLAKSSEPRLETFTLFPKLPQELRNKIWNHASMISRNITVIIGRQYRHQIGQLPAPSVLQATHESRTEAMRYYTLCIDYAAPPSAFVRILGGKGHPPVWINFSVDVFLRGSEACYHHLAVKAKFNFDDSVLSQNQHVEMKCNGEMGFHKHISNFRTIMVQKHLMNFTMVMCHQGQPQGQSWLEKDLSFLEREEQCRQIIAKQQKRIECSVRPHIIWKRNFWVGEQYF